MKRTGNSPEAILRGAFSTLVSYGAKDEVDRLIKFCVSKGITSEYVAEVIADIRKEQNIK